MKKNRTGKEIKAKIKKQMIHFIHIFRPIYIPIVSFIKDRSDHSGKIFCVLKFIKHVSAQDFREYIKNYGMVDFSISDGVAAVPAFDHPVIHLPVHVLGPLNKGKVIMLLENQSYNGGFCALWIYFLNRLSFSDKMGFYHVIDWNESEFYMEDHPVNGTTSIFEYYFEQPAGISLEEARNSNCVVYDWNNPEYGYDDVFHVGDQNDYRFTSADIEHLSKIQRKYIHLHSSIEKAFREQIEKLFQGKTKVLGVHARGADMKIAYKNHPVGIKAEEYVQTAEKYMEKIEADIIFLATDDQEMLDIFKQRFGNKLVYYDDVVRSSGTVMNCFMDGERENHHYLLGLEILRDVYTLAACSGLVCGMSYVGCVVQILKKSYKQEFDAFCRISKGYRKEGIDLTDASERAKIRQKWYKELNMTEEEKQRYEKKLR